MDLSRGSVCLPRSEPQCSPQGEVNEANDYPSWEKPARPGPQRVDSVSQAWAVGPGAPGSSEGSGKG